MRRVRLRGLTDQCTLILMAVTDRDDHDDMCHCSYQGRPWRPRAKDFLRAVHKDNLTFPEGKLRLFKKITAHTSVMAW